MRSVGRRRVAPRPRALRELFLHRFQTDVAYILTFDEIDHVFADVGRMIADALERLDRPEHVQQIAGAVSPAGGEVREGAVGDACLVTASLGMRVSRRRHWGCLFPKGASGDACFPKAPVGLHVSRSRQ